jgi:hypothetical protein
MGGRFRFGGLRRIMRGRLSRQNGVVEDVHEHLQNSDPDADNAVTGGRWKEVD